MLKPFKFFQEEERVFSEYMDRMDDYFLGGISGPPIGLDISNRHWNILPQDIREMSSIEIMAYIEGWESPQVGNVYNPYPDNFRLGNIWTRGWSHRQTRNR